MKKAAFSFCAAALLAASASAQIPGTGVTTLFQDDPDVRAFTGATDSDPNTLQALSDGRLVFFESEATAGNNAEDAVLLFDPSQVGTARFSVLASEAILAALIGEPAPVIFAEDMAVDENDNVYLLGAQSVTGSEDSYFVVKIPNTAGTFGAPQLIAGPGVAPLGIPPTDGFGAIEYDAANERLILLLSENLDEDSLSGIAGLYTLPVLPGQSSPVQSLATRADMVAQLTPVPTSDPSDRATFEDIAVLPNGDVLATFNVRSGQQADGDSDGDVVRVTSLGAASLFVDAVDLRLDVADSFGSTSMWIQYNASRNAVALLEEFTSFTERNVIAEYSPAGVFQGVVADFNDLVENSGATELRVFSRAFDSGPGGEYYVFTGINNESCQQISIGSATAAEHWWIY